MSKTNNWMAALVLCGVLITAVSAKPITMHFTASGFQISNSNPAPDDPVTGTIVWDAASPNADVGSITSITLTVGGHTYSVSEIGYGALFGHGVIGGFYGGGPAGVEVLTNDFWIIWDKPTLLPLQFMYASASLSGIWEASQFDSFSITAEPDQNQTMPIPTMSAWGMMLLSALVCLVTGVMMRRHLGTLSTVGTTSRRANNAM
jgi:hypothetical protein